MCRLFHSPMFWREMCAKSERIYTNFTPRLHVVIKRWEDVVLMWCAVTLRTGQSHEANRLASGRWDEIGLVRTKYIRTYMNTYTHTYIHDKKVMYLLFRRPGSERVFTSQHLEDGPLRRVKSDELTASQSHSLVVWQVHVQGADAHAPQLMLMQGFLVLVCIYWNACTRAHVVLDAGVE
jgi:hypothetical protein